MRTLLTCLLLTGCLTTADMVGRPPPTYAPGQPITFNGFRFLLEEASIAHTYHWNNGLLKVDSESGFVFVRLTAKSLGSKPVPYALQPLPSLIDQAGNVYEHSLQHSVQFNFPKQVAVDGMNPGVSRTWTYVFEAPPQQYRLRVLTPSVATAGFMNESVNVRGRFFFYNLASLLRKSPSATPLGDADAAPRRGGRTY